MQDADVQLHAHQNADGATGYVELSWTPMPGAESYTLAVFNGEEYELFPAGSGSYWSTENKGIWPTAEERAAGRTRLHGAEKGAQLFIDRTPPSAPEAAITPDDWSSADKAALTWSGVTDLTELARVEYAFDDGDYLPTGLTDKERVGFTLDLSALADGEHTLRLRAVYLAGNVGEACALPVWRDTLPPAVVNLTLSPDGWTNGGNLVSATDANGNTATATYDGRGRLLTLTDALGNVTSYTYDLNGNLVSERLADGSETRYTYDACGRVSSVTGGGERVTYRYDAAGNLLCVGGPEGTTTYTYDCMSRVTSLTEPDGSCSRYRYDLAGQLAEMTDMNGIVSSYEWDACGNLLLYTDTAGGYTAYYYDKAALTYACLNLIKLAKKRWKTRPIPSLFQFVLDFLTDFFNIYAANPLPA